MLTRHALPVSIELTLATPPERVTIRPLQRQIAHIFDHSTIRFSLTAPCHVCVEIDNLPQLFIHLDPPETDVPHPEDPRVRFFSAGILHEPGEMVLQTGQAIYLAGGAVVRGRIYAQDAANVRVYGCGILIAQPDLRARPRHRVVHFARCNNICVDGIMIWNHTAPCTWTAACYGCSNVLCRHVKELTCGNGSDGIDLVSCRDAVIEDCCLTTGDDAIVIKAFCPDGAPPYNTDVNNILVQRCLLQAISCGSALEIGHELRTALVENITFRDCDILGVHGHGAAISIRNGDRALVRHIRYENIRIEHYYARLFVFRVIRSRYSRDIERGHIREVLLKNIRVTQSIYNPGYSISTIGDYDAAHTITGVVFEDVFLDNTKVLSAQQLDLFTRDASDIIFC